MGDLDLAELRKACLANLYSCTNNVSKYLDNEKENEFQKLRNYVQEYCKLELHEKASQQALEIVESEFEEAGLESLENRYHQELTRLSKSNKKFDNHPYVKELEKHIKEAERANRGAGHGEDSDLAIVEVHSAHIDPISQRRIINPMRNKICKHVYEQETIESFITQKNKGCPYVGCTNKKQMKTQDLFFDTELKNTLDSVALESDLSQSMSVLSDE